MKKGITPFHFVFSFFGFFSFLWFEVSIYDLFSFFLTFSKQVYLCHTHFHSHSAAHCFLSIQSFFTHFLNCVNNLSHTLIRIFFGWLILLDLFATSCWNAILVDSDTEPTNIWFIVFFH